MLDESILSLELPYRDPLDVRAFSFGIDASGKALGKGGDASALERSLCVVAGIRGDEILQTLVCAWSFPVPTPPRWALDDGSGHSTRPI